MQIIRQDIYTVKRNSLEIFIFIQKPPLCEGREREKEMKDDSRQVVQLKETRGKTIPTSAEIRLVNGIGAVPPLLSHAGPSKLLQVRGKFRLSLPGLRLPQPSHDHFSAIYVKKKKYPILNVKSIPSPFNSVQIRNSISIN